MIKNEKERSRIGQRIVQLRNGLGVTQVELAERIGTSQANIARIESGRYSISLDTLTAIASALGVRIDFV